MAQPSPSRVCPNCGADVRSGWLACPACAIRLDGAEARDGETQTVLTAPPSSASSSEEGRFPAGTVLAARYRVLGLIGQGGMGEVYRAYDLILNQAVALKFLGRANMSESALARFRNEVRIARQVSHPNVCRVYDIGFIEGLHFLSMEYLDGEDLHSLLRRIGRLPQDKAIEFARKICAGLAAAHDRGVLHRDLKPANIMIDGRGQLRITDFGLAALAREVALGDIRSGTPAYMSPEQKAGKEVTIRSDIYSLGLTLYEMFTGKRRSQTESNPSEILKDIDPAVERVILRCLEDDPKRRPSSALSVAMALPGGDPIAAALAAGETPSPEMVAASEEKEGFSSRAAWLCFMASLVMGVVLTVVLPSVSMFGRGRAQIDIPPEALAFRAQDILKRFGYPKQPKSTAYGFECCDQTNARLVAQQGARRDAILSSHQPPIVRFWYRQSQGLFLADLAPGAITYDLPANIEPGMIRLAEDAKARLIALEVRPNPVESENQGAEPPRSFDWAALFEAAGLNAARFTSVPPELTPPMAFDTRAAWTGVYAEGRSEQIRVEAAAWHGRPVYFEVAGAWHPIGTPSTPGGIPGSPEAVTNVLLACGLIGAGLLARRNIRLWRGDRKGAGRIAAFVFLCFLGYLLLHMTHVATSWELALLFAGIGFCGLITAFMWLGYLALEPYARRRWPDAFISWNRILEGRVRDPLIASHVLAGLTIVPVLICVQLVVRIFVSAPPLINSPQTIQSLNSVTDFAANLILCASIEPVVESMIFLVLVVLLRTLLRKVWVADLLTAVVLAYTNIVLIDDSTSYRMAATWAANLLFFYASIWLFRRLGYTAVVALCVSGYLSLLGTPYISFTAWYAGRMLVTSGILVALAAWCLWVIISNKRGASIPSPA